MHAGRTVTRTYHAHNVALHQTIAPCARALERKLCHGTHCLRSTRGSHLTPFTHGTCSLSCALFLLRSLSLALKRTHFLSRVRSLLTTQSTALPLSHTHTHTHINAHARTHARTRLQTDRHKPRKESLDGMLAVYVCMISLSLSLSMNKRIHIQNKKLPSTPTQ